MKETAEKIMATVGHYTEKRFSTIAGTLAYFFLMSLAPFIVWLTLLLGQVDLSRVLPDAVFGSVAPFLEYLNETAQSAAGGAGIILLITSLYSSTNFFYHLRRSGEIIYGTRAVKGGVKLRIISAALIILSILLLAVVAAAGVAFGRVLGIFMPAVPIAVFSFLFFAAVAFFTAVLLNLFACPYKLRFSEAVKGSALTTALWIAFAAGFAVYLKFGSPGKLYGAIASVIVFLLWCYFMMCCLVIGMIKNGSELTEKELKRRL